MAKDDLPRGQLTNIILSTLTATDKYGYEIIDTIKESTNGALIVKQPSLYSCLRRMEEQGLISSYWRDSEIGGRRHYYSITDYGKKYAEKWQADLSSYKFEKPKEEAKKEEPVETPISSGTILQQTNLFGSEVYIGPKEEQKEEIQEDKHIPNSFVQYDLFSTPTLISEPSDGILDCIKRLRDSADEIPNTQADNISALRNSEQQPIENQVEIKTNYVSSDHNPNNTDISQSDIKKTFMELSKQQKSFVDVLKENPNTIVFDEIDIEDDEPNLITDNNDEEISNLSSILNQVKPEPTTTPVHPFAQPTETSYNEETTKPVIEEKPTIVQSTTQFKTEDDEDEFGNDAAAFEFIDLNAVDSSPSFVSQPKEEYVFTSSEDEPDQDIQPVTAQEPTTSQFKQQTSTVQEEVEQKQTQTYTPKDDAVYITEKPNLESIPKVKKIAPARFENYARYDSRIDEKVSKLYEKHNEQDRYTQEQVEPAQEEYNYYNENYTEYNDYYYEEQPAEQQKTVVPSGSDFDSLKEYYKTLNIKFGIYKKQKNRANNNYVNKSKLDLLTSLIISGFAIIASIIMYIILADSQPTWNWLYIVCPTLLALVSVYSFVIFVLNNNQIATKATYLNYNWVYKLIITVVIILVTFSINLLGGMELDGISNNLTTFLYPCALSICLPLTSIIHYILIKFNAVKIK